MGKMKNLPLLATEIDDLEWEEAMECPLLYYVHNEEIIAHLERELFNKSMEEYKDYENSCP